MDSCVVAAARYASTRGDGPPSDSQLRFALAEVIAEHAALSMQLFVDGSGKPNFVRLRSINLSDVIEHSAAEVDVQQAFQDQLARSFRVECEHPLWRVTVLSNGSIVFAYHHGIADGQSGITIHMAILKALNNLPDPLLHDPPTIVDSIPTTGFLPALEQLTNTSISFHKLCGEAFDILAPQSWRASYGSWTGNPVIKVPSVVTNVRSWRLSPADASRLLQLCREHGCTLTAFIYTLSAEAFSRVLASRTPETLERYKTLSIGISHPSFYFPMIYYSFFDKLKSCIILYPLQIRSRSRVLTQVVQSDCRSNRNRSRFWFTGGK